MTCLTYQHMNDWLSSQIAQSIIYSLFFYVTPHHHRICAHLILWIFADRVVLYIEYINQRHTQTDLHIATYSTLFVLAFCISRRIFFDTVKFRNWVICACMNWRGRTYLIINRLCFWWARKSSTWCPVHHSKCWDIFLYREFSEPLCWGLRN